MLTIGREWITHIQGLYSKLIDYILPRCFIVVGTCFNMTNVSTQNIYYWQGTAYKLPRRTLRIINIGKQLFMYDPGAHYRQQLTVINNMINIGRELFTYDNIYIGRKLFTHYQLEQSK